MASSNCPNYNLPAEPSQGKRSAKVKGLAYFGQFMGPARDQRWGTWPLAYCGSERPKNLDVLVLLREPRRKSLQDFKLNISTLELCSAAVSLILRSPDLASPMGVYEVFSAPSPRT
jgi:hypothetical protein